MITAPSDYSSSVSAATTPSSTNYCKTTSRKWSSGGIKKIQATRAGISCCLRSPALWLLSSISARRGFEGLVGAWGAADSFGVTAGILSGAVADGVGVGGGGVRLTVECLEGAKGGRLSLMIK
ncbi:hypothetical protein IQ274_34660 [Nostoc sp. LEGE 12447]|uniref:hypothetical protein n=1 Tax=Nostoc sp. LEGE 12447 TaxID=1828640 RepID=UPI0018843AB5|nr:hypothetical protein [Nostoc sp. LEGE 12447]MBE9003166.1 hypothetical protein [Nostoc sp. LEGE 12447]